jgi:hypothetical protein
MELTKYYLFRRSEMSVFFLALNQKGGGVNDMARSEKKERSPPQSSDR